MNTVTLNDASESRLSVIPRQDRDDARQEVCLRILQGLPAAEAVEAVVADYWREARLAPLSDSRAALSPSWTLWIDTPAIRRLRLSRRQWTIVLSALAWPGSPARTLQRVTGIPRSTFLREWVALRTNLEAAARRSRGTVEPKSL